MFFLRVLKGWSISKRKCCSSLFAGKGPAAPPAERSSGGAVTFKSWQPIVLARCDMLLYTATAEQLHLGKILEKKQSFAGSELPSDDGSGQ